MNDDLRNAARALLDARDAEMLTGEHWEALAAALEPTGPAPTRFGYDPAHGLVGYTQDGGATSALPDEVGHLAGAIEEYGGAPRTVEELREAVGFALGRAAAMTGLAFLAHAGLAVRGPDGRYAGSGADLERRAVDALHALETVALAG